MRRATLVFALGMAFTSYVLPQEPAGAAETKQQAEQGDPWLLWKWVNFLILAGGLAYLISKNAPAMFQARSEQIEKTFAEAARMKKEADAQAAAIELRLKNLQVEIDNLRQSARAEIAAQGDRIRRETEQHLARIQEQSAQEIHLMTRGARAELRKYSAELAIQLAEQRIRARMTPDIQQALADGFIEDLRSRTPAVART
jgi:F-type H+-transporting ATPase subunit b